MKEDFVTHEQAVKLKELGFDWDCVFIYYFTYHNHNKSIFQRYETVRDYEMEKYWYAPTLAQAQKWLREVKQIIIIPCVMHIKDIMKYDFYIADEPLDVEYDFEGFDTYELALSAGIDKTLELIKNEI